MAEPRTAPIFIVGCQRSGTTGLRLMLDSHPDISCGPETRFLKWMEPMTSSDWDRLSRFGFPREYWLQKTADFFASTHAEYAKARGKRRWADKSPLYALILPFVWELFPDAQVIHLIRDPRDVAASHRRAYGWRSAFKAPVKWQRYIRAARAAAANVPDDRYLEIRYEALVQDREGTVRQVLEFLGESWDARVLDVEASPHDVNPRYWDRSRHRLRDSRSQRSLDPVLTVASKVLARPLSKEMGY